MSSRAGNSSVGQRGCHLKSYAPSCATMDKAEHQASDVDMVMREDSVFARVDSDSSTLGGRSWNDGRWIESIPNLHQSAQDGTFSGDFAWYHNDISGYYHLNHDQSWEVDAFLAYGNWDSNVGGTLPGARLHFCQTRSR